MSNKSSKTSDENSIENKATYLTVFNISVMVGLLVIQSVPRGDIFFAVFASVHTYVMSRVAFPKVGAKPAVGGWRFKGADWLPRYLLFAAVLGLLLPLLQILIAFSVGDQTTLQESAPHLFLLCAQVLSENLTFSVDSLALPIKAVIPVLYNARRLLNLQSWVVAVFSRDMSSSVSFAATMWGLFGRSLVVGNVLLWHFNLWCFLLPVYVPWALQTHYTGVNAPWNAHVECVGVKD